MKAYEHWLCELDFELNHMGHLLRTLFLAFKSPLTSTLDEQKSKRALIHRRMTYENVPGIQPKEILEQKAMDQRRKVTYLCLLGIG